MFLSRKHPVVVLTDDGATKRIVERITMATTSIDRANRRLINASIYLSEYRLSSHHIPGRQNTVPDALSRLPARLTDQEKKNLANNECSTRLDHVCLATEAFMESRELNAVAPNPRFTGRQTDVSLGQ